MGLERCAYLLQGVDNLYEIDEVAPVLRRAAELAGVTYGRDHEADVRLRVVADHVRSGLMLIGDGITPGNEGRGYILRRLLRRAVRSMKLLGVDEATLPELLPVSRDAMSASYPELAADFDRIGAVAYAEEEAFRRTLTSGTTLFDTAVREAKQAGTPSLSGEQAFSLHDTFGFPIDVTLEMAAEQGVTVDEEGFRALMKQQRDRARADARAKRTGAVDVLAYRRLLTDHGPTDWRAYETLRTDSRVLALVSDLEDDGGPAAPRARARSPGSCSTRRRSTRSPVARWPTPASSPGTAAAPRCSTSSARSRGWSSTRCGCSRASCARAPSWWPRSTASGGCRPARRTRAPTWCTPRCARCSARRRCSPARTTARATCGWTSPGRARCRASSAPTSRTSPTPPSAPTTGSPRAG